MEKRKDYLPPVARSLGYPEEPVLVLSARPGGHEYDEGYDSEEGWKDAWSGDDF